MIVDTLVVMGAAWIVLALLLVMVQRSLVAIATACASSGGYLLSKAVQEHYGEPDEGRIPKYCRGHRRTEYTAGGGEYICAIPASPEFGGQCRPADFRILSKLARGGYGQVALVTHQPSGRQYAMKVFTARKASRHAMIRTEECHQRQVRHILVTRLYCSMRSKGEVRLVMELIDGATLHQVLLGNDHRVAGTVDIRRAAAQLVLLLEHLHDVEGLVFGDLTSRNVMINRAGNIRLIDFGFSKAIGSGRLESPTFPRGRRQPAFSQNPFIDWYGLGQMILEMSLAMRLRADGVLDSNRLKELIDRDRIAALPCKVLTDRTTCSLVKGLCRTGRWRRALGMTPEGRRALRAHPWFTSVDWDTLLQ